MTELATINAGAQALADMAVLSLPSPASRRVYRAHLARYIASGAPLSREGVQAYAAWLRDEEGRTPSSVNQALQAIKRLAREAWARDLMKESELAAILRVETTRQRGTRTGNWLELGALKALIDAAERGDGEGLNGTRNAAIIAVLAGCGLRREEVAGLRWTQFAQRSGRWCFVDLCGKGNKLRTVPVPDWVARRLNQWRDEQEREKAGLWTETR